MKKKSATRVLLEVDDRVPTCDADMIEFRAIRLLAGALLRVGLHLEVDPAPDPAKVRLFAVRRAPTREVQL